MRSVFVMLFVLVASGDALASPAGDVAAQIVDVLRSDDLARLAKIIDEHADSRAYEEFRGILDRHDCIRVDRYEWFAIEESAASAAFRMDLFATASLKADWRPERILPRTWHIEAKRVNGSWRISRAITEERRFALAMAAASQIDAERLLAGVPETSLGDLAILYAYEIERSGAINRFEHAISIAQRAGDIRSEVEVLRRYATALTNVDRKRMLDVARRCENLARTAGSRDDIALALLTLGLAQLNNGERARARETYASGAAMIEMLDDPIVALKCLQMYIWSGRGGPQGPLMTLRETTRLLQLARRYGWEEGEGVALFNHAVVHWEIGNIDVVREDCLELIRLSELHGNRKFVSSATYNLGLIDVRESHDEQAILRFREALVLETDVGMQATILNALASAHIRLNQFAETERVLLDAEAKAGKSGLANVEGRRLRSVLHHERGETEQAIAAARDALRLLDSMPGEKNFHAWVYVTGTLARALRAAGRTEEAIAEYRTAIAIIEGRGGEIGAGALGLAAFLHDYVDTYVELVELLVERNELEEAFRVAETMKARGLHEAMAASRIDLSASLTTEERTHEASLQKRVAELNRALLTARQKQTPVTEIERDLFSARRSLDEFRSEIALKYPAVARRRHDAQPAVELPARSPSLALIEYVVAEKQVIAFVLTNDAPIRTVRIPIDRGRLEHDARELEALIAARTPDYRNTARALYDKLLVPLARDVDGKATLIIVPDGVLWRVPFHVLMQGDQHLIDKHAVFYAHSLALLRDASALPVAAESGLIALGNPAVGGDARSTVRAVFRDAALGPLIHAEEEVRALSSMYPRERSRIYTRGSASEMTFKREASRFSIIHLAAHAVVDDRMPMYSAIVLANSSVSEDGLLEAREIVDLPLQADLAVLSACQTARGRLRGGEGVIGLSWAFLAAGCPTTVVSQWNAESEATARLMIEMHRRMRAGETVASALRSAQLSVRRVGKYRHPFYWAPFVAVGAASRSLSVW